MIEMIKKGKQCIECFNNKTKIFRNENDLLKFLEEKRIKSKVPKTWLEKIIDDGYIQLFWCSEQKPTRPTVNLLNHGNNYKRVICPGISK